MTWAREYNPDEDNVTADEIVRAAAALYLDGTSCQELADGRVLARVGDHRRGGNQHHRHKRVSSPDADGDRV